jgi:hypothetical protein
MPSGQTTRFLNYKLAKELLKDKEITEYHITRLDKLFGQIPLNKLGDWIDTISKFVLYDLNNYSGRIRRLKTKIAGTDYAYFLRYGRQYLEIKKDHNEKKTRHFKNKISYWLDLGYTEEESVEKVKELQKQNAANAAELLRGTNIYSCRSMAYWLRKGYSEDDARKEVKRVNTTNGLGFYVKKYGEEEGSRMYDSRLNSWLQTLDSKTDDEKALISKKKGPSIEGNMARGLSLEQATARYKDHCEKMKSKVMHPFSKISQDLFKRLDEKITGACYYHIKNYEYNISGFRVDFYHKESKTVIEFYGDFFHRHPEMFAEDYVCFGKSSKEVWEYDTNRAAVIEKHPVVDQLIIVWETDYRKNPVETVNKLLSNIGEKYVR